ncbi:MAG: glycosyltransferase [Acidobacteria bacterium]|nr:glycosyltransferase [Acidobacteriota bacterium]
MRVLFTNVALETRGGSELYVLDVARWLRASGHRPVVYSARLGELAETFRRHAIPVIDDLTRLGEPPDVIHAQHHLPAISALARFPSTPAVYVCHGWLPWEEAPLRHPGIRAYVGVSTATAERLIAEHGIPPSLVHRLPNFVDTARFTPREPLPSRPARALLFSNQAEDTGWSAVVAAACADRNIPLDIAGWRSGRPLDDPAAVLPGYDLVFARGRSALEAMAVGCAVILCDAEGLGPMVRPANLEALADGNFGIQILTQTHRVDHVVAEIDAYDPAATTAVAAAVRQHRTLDVVAPRLLALYEQAMADAAARPTDDAAGRAAVVDYLAWLHGEFPVPALKQRQMYAGTLTRLEQQVRDGHHHLTATQRTLADVIATHQRELADLRQHASEERAALDAHAQTIDAERTALQVTLDRTIAAAADQATALDTAETRAREALLASDAHAAARTATDATIRDLQTRLDAEHAQGAALAERLRVIEGGFLYRRVLPLLWRGRLALLPDGSRRLALFKRLRSPGGRVLIRPGRPRPAVDVDDPAECATAIPPDTLLGVVVMDINAQPTLPAAVRSLLDQVPQPEVVVVTSGAGHASDLLAREGIDVPVIHVSTRLLPGGARNAGIAATRAPFVAFLASDSVAQPGWVAGRLAAHAAGADVVSSPVVNLTPANPFASAMHTLLYPARLPETPRHARLHYGVSLARTVFTRLGVYRSDLRTGEDTELRERAGGRLRMVYRADVRTAHRNPTTLGAFLRDQQSRGALSVQARDELYGGSSRRLVVRNSLRRVRASVALALESTPPSERLNVWLGLPWVLPGALAYAWGAARGAVARDAPIRPLTDPAPVVPAARVAPLPAAARTRLLAVVSFRNERHYLPGLLDNLSPQVDGIIGLDDGSSDGSAEIAAAHPAVIEVIRCSRREPHRLDERRNRRLLIDAAGRHGAEWVLAVDADERIEDTFRDGAERLIRDNGAEGPLAYWLVLRELWDRPDQYRVDGIWGRKQVARLFRWRADHDFGPPRALHGHWAPENSRLPGDWFAHSGLVVYHLRMIREADRVRRRDRYARLDPHNEWQAIGYDYLVDTDGLGLAPLPADRGYTPMPAVDADAPPPLAEPVGLVGARVGSRHGD